MRIHGLVAVKTSDYDLWSNSVTLRALVVDPEVGSVRFGLREKDGSWNEIEGTPSGNNYYTATFAPEWSDATDPDRPADGGSYPAIYQQTEGTGIFAAHEYEYRADLGGTQQSGSFTTAAGDAIYNAGMEYWSTYTVKGGSLTSAEVPYPNEAASKTFWTSGNNKQTNALCTGQAIAGNNGSQCAALQPKATMGVFAAGNLFTGEYVMNAGTNGIITFGRPFTLRPTKLRIWVRYNRGVIDRVKSSPAGTEIKVGDNDNGHVYIALGTWSAEEYGKDSTGEQRGSSDSPICIDTRDVSTFFKSDGKDVVGYGEYVFKESVEEWTQITIPIEYRTTGTRPTHLMIVCSASRWGDYFTGSTKSEMWLDDFELLYD